MIKFSELALCVQRIDTVRRLKKQGLKKVVLSNEWRLAAASAEILATYGITYKE